MSIDLPAEKSKPLVPKNHANPDIYQIEQEKDKQLNRKAIALCGLLTVATIGAFLVSLLNRLSQFSQQPDGSFPVSHWLDYGMGFSGFLAIVFFITTVSLANKLWAYRFRQQSVIVGILASLMIFGSIAGVTKLMDTAWESNMKSWGMERYGIEYEIINSGWIQPVVGSGGCTSNYNPFAPNGFRNTTSCDIEESGRTTYLLVSKEGRYVAELMETEYGYKAYKATATPQPEELPILNQSE